MHVAMFEAYNGIERRFTSIHDVSGEAPRGASKRAAVVYAAYNTLLALLPAQAADFANDLDASLAGIAADSAIEHSESIARGREWGEHVAAEIVAWRNTDGLNPPPPPYLGSLAVGKWRPTPPAFEELFKAGKITLELVPQGTIAERIRAAAVGVPAFYTPTAVGTRLAEGKETREFDGRTYVMERALNADVALIQAWRADRWGNLTYRGTGRNFNPVMAMAAKLTIVQTRHMVELGELDPESIVTPGIFVNRVVHVESADPPPA
jgi:hypothetical protein